MIYRTEDHEKYITQKEHARFSSELVKSWENESFPKPRPFEAVRYAAEIHDFGWEIFEKYPEINPFNDKPYDFQEAPIKSKVGIWKLSREKALENNLYSGYLVAKHCLNLSKMAVNHHSMSPESEDDIKQYWREESNVVEKCMYSLKDDTYFSQYLDQKRIAYNQEVLRIVDWISLIICLGIKDKSNFPSSLLGEEFRVKFVAKNDTQYTYKLKPYPLNQRVFYDKVIINKLNTEQTVNKYVKIEPMK